MKVFILSTGVFNRQYGQQRYELNFLQSLFLFYPKFFFRVILLNDKKIEPPLLNLNKNIKFICCGKRIRLISKIKFVLFGLFYFIKDKPKFLICGHMNLSVLSFFLYKLWGIPYIILTHGTDAWNIRGIFRRYALISAKKVISVSRYTAQRIEKQIPSLKNKIFIIPNSVDTEKFSPKEKPNYLLEKYKLFGYKIILTVARLDSYDRDKGYDKVILALPKVLEAIPNLKYILVGEGDDLPRIKDLISKLNLNDRVILTGYISDDKLSDYYNLCDLFIMPSKQEGFGIVFLEALACGKPVIAGNKDGSREALLDGKLGILVDPDNIEEITQTTIKVLNKEVQPYLLDAFYLSRTIKENFSKDIFFRKIKGFFDEVIISR
jgi:glycosyltransferase involved in cell wall biosynthesis